MGNIFVIAGSKLLEEAFSSVVDGRSLSSCVLLEVAVTLVLGGGIMTEEGLTTLVSFSGSDVTTSGIELECLATETLLLSVNATFAEGKGWDEGVVTEGIFASSTSTFGAFVEGRGAVDAGEVAVVVVVETGGVVVAGAGVVAIAVGGTAVETGAGSATTTDFPPSSFSKSLKASMSLPPSF